MTALCSFLIAKFKFNHSYRFNITPKIVLRSISLMFFRSVTQSLFFHYQEVFIVSNEIFIHIPTQICYGSPLSLSMAILSVLSRRIEVILK
jgi:hypothetical protein